MRSITLLLLLLLPALLQAQTTVNLSVTDTPDNQTWNNGTWTVKLIQNPAFNFTGSGFTLLSGGGSLGGQTGTLSGAGTASISLPANANIAPQSLWQFTVCPQASAQCFQQNVTVSTSSPQTLNMTPPSIRINLTTAAPPVSLYATGEVTQAVLGSQFFLIGTGQQFCTAVTGTTCNTWGGSTSGGGAALAGNANAIYLAPTCPQIPSGNCYFVNADVKNLFDGVWTSGQSTMSSASASFQCPGGVYPCSAGGDVGKNIFGIASCGSQGPTGTNAPSIGAASTTITTVNSATQVTLSISNTGTVAAGGCFFYGHIDDMNISTAETAANALVGCTAFILPANLMFIASAHFITASTTCDSTKAEALGGNSIFGQGREVSRFILMPQFSFASCTGGAGSNVCFGGRQGEVWQNFSFFGGYNQRNGSNAGKLLISKDTATLLDNFICAGFGSNDTNLVGLNVLGAEFYAREIVMNGCGNIGVSFNGALGTSIVESHFDNNATEEWLLNGGSVVESANNHFIGNNTGTSAIVNAGGTLYSVQDQCTNVTACLSNASTAYISKGTFDTSAVSASNPFFSNGGTQKLYIRDTFAKGGATGTVFNNTSGGTIFDEGGNVYTAGTTFLNSAAATFVPLDGVKAQCTGVATASSTLALNISGVSLTGTGITTACTSTTLDKGQTMKGARTLAMLTCSSSATTVSVACTVMLSHNGGAFSSTGITCTMTAATSCFDGTHSAAVADGDLVTIQIVTGAAETGANVKAAVGYAN